MRADVVSRVTRDVEAVTEAVADAVPTFVGAAFAIVLTEAGLTLLDPWLALAAALAIPVQIIVTLRFLRRSRPLYTRLRREEAARGQALVESVAGAGTVRAHRWQDARLNLVAQTSEKAITTQRAATRARNGFNGGLNLAEFIGLGAVLSAGFWRVLAAGLSVGSVTAGALFFHRLFGPIGAVLGSIDDLQRAAAGLERLVGVLLAPRGDPGSFRSIAHHGVLVRDVSFRYGSVDQPDVIEGLSVSIAEHTVVACVGESGSGKSTFAHLVAGLVTPRRGEVLVGGVPAHRARQGGRPAVMVVTQETHLFLGSVADNLRLGNPTATTAQLQDALAALGIPPERFGRDLEAEATARLTHADVQLLALARVALADPAVLVLDEATAHSANDEVLMRAAHRITLGRTTIVIAHRLSQVRDADEILVFSDGRIAERGQFEDLVAKRGGRFAELWAASGGA